MIRPTHTTLVKFFGIFSILFVLTVSTVSLLTLPETSHEYIDHAIAPNALDQAIILDVLTNIKQNGYNNNNTITNGIGGLWVNWRYGTNPLLTNFNGTGSPDGPAVNPPREDPLTDIRYLHNLYLYKSQNPGDRSFDDEIARFEPIIEKEFANNRNERGWLYDEEFADIYSLTHIQFYKDTMMATAANLMHSIDPAAGISIKKSANHPLGFYRPIDDVTQGAALVMAGTTFNNPAWIAAGQFEINFVFTHALIPKEGVFTDQMDQVFTTAGSINPDESFYIDTYRNYTIHGNGGNMGQEAQIAISLLNAYKVSHISDLLTKAENLLDPFLLPANKMTMWDTVNKGYFEAYTYTGSTFQTAGSFIIKTAKKEAGRQSIMLWAYHLADQIDNNKYAQMESAMHQVVEQNSYYKPGHGALYEVSPSWQPLNIKGMPEDWVTTEAMGALVEALLIENESDTTLTPTPIATTIAPTISTTLTPVITTPITITSTPITNSGTAKIMQTQSATPTSLETPRSTTTANSQFSSANQIQVVNKKGTPITNAAILYTNKNGYASRAQTDMQGNAVLAPDAAKVNGISLDGKNIPLNFDANGTELIKVDSESGKVIAITKQGGISGWIVLLIGLIVAGCLTGLIYLRFIKRKSI